MSKYVYLFELDSVRKTDEEIIAGQAALYDEIVTNGNIVVLTYNQMVEADQWAQYLAKEYGLNEEMLSHNFKIIHTMNERQMQASIGLLKDLIAYHFAMIK